jgi:hypothetical protein
MDDDRVELEQGEGEVQETWADVKEKVGGDGDADQGEGMAKQGEGKRQETFGDVNKKAGGMWDNAKNPVDGDNDKAHP